MKAKLNQYISKLTGIISLFLMILVILFSSCTIRKSVQAQLGIPVTKSLNASKAIVNSVRIEFDDCKTLSEQLVTRVHHHQLKVFSDGFLLDSIALLLQFISLVQLKNIISFAAERRFSIPLPFYILYKKMKVPA